MPQSYWKEPVKIIQAVGNEQDTNDNFDVSDDDDTTIDQDLSSLQSEAVPSQSLPSWASHSRFLFISYPVLKTTTLLKKFNGKVNYWSK